MRHATTGTTRRDGSVSVWLLFSLSLLILAFMLAINSGWLALNQMQLQTGADGAAYAAAGTLVTDDRLKPSPNVAAISAAAQDEGVCFAERNWDPTRTDCTALNPVIVTPMDVTIAPNLDRVDVLASRTKARLNPVRIFLGNFYGDSEFEVLARSAVILDRNVVGFRPFGGRIVPMMPIGLESDASAAPLVTSWEFQTGPSGLVDVFSYNPGTGPPPWSGPLPLSPDGLREMTFAVNPVGLPQGVSICLLGIGPGATDNDVFLDQVRDGMRTVDLPGGEFVLAPGTNTQTVSLTGSPLTLAQLNTLLLRLQAISNSGEARIWPLLRSCDSLITNTAVVHGFVAARIANVTLQMQPGGPTITVVIQPAMIATATAVTEIRTMPPGPPYLVPNPYVVKIRLAN